MDKRTARTEYDLLCWVIAQPRTLTLLGGSSTIPGLTLSSPGSQFTFVTPPTSDAGRSTVDSHSLVVVALALLGAMFLA